MEMDRFLLCGLKVVLLFDFCLILVIAYLGYFIVKLEEEVNELERRINEHLDEKS